MTRTLSGLALALLALLVGAPSEAGRVLYLAREERICDVARVACVDGSLTYRVNTRVLYLYGRLESSPGPGTLVITVKGTSRLGYVRYAPLEVTLRGRASEIVRLHMIPDEPDVENWQIERVEYLLER